MKNTQGVQHRLAIMLLFVALVAGMTLTQAPRTAEAATCQLNTNDLPWACGVPPKPDSSYGAYSTFAVVPDTQYLTSALSFDRYGGLGPTYFGYILNDMQNWIIRNKTNENIQFVLGLGDITQVGGRRDSAFTESQLFFNELIRFGIPFFPMVGNHDYDAANFAANTNDYAANSNNDAFNFYGGDRNIVRSLAMFNYFYNSKTFGTSANKFAKGFKPDQMQNAYYRVSFGGSTYGVMTLEYYPATDVIKWANDVLSDSAYANDKVIIATHSYLSKDAEPTNKYHAKLTTSAAGGRLTAESNNNGSEVFKNLILPSNKVVMTFSGHELVSKSNLIPVLPQQRQDGTYLYSTLSDLEEYEGCQIYYVTDCKEVVANNSPTAKHYRPYGAILLVRVAQDSTKMNLCYYATLRNAHLPCKEVQMKEPKPTVSVTQATATNGGKASIAIKVVAPATTTQYSTNGGATWTNYLAGALNSITPSKTANTTYLIRAATDTTNGVNASDAVAVTVNRF